MKTVNDIRATFLDFYQARGHQIVPSAPLVPQNDPTLMFVNAGMVPFKNVFTGIETRDYSRATSSQKCVRAGGKHNDLDNVGYTARHHTFFEMLGNFSFGDYFKEEAILSAWELITKEYGLDPSRLLATVYHTDDQAYDLWKKIAGLPDDKIIRIATNDNFWSMGDTGPCGPCSEIFYDHGEAIPGGPPGSPDEVGDRFIEIWNLVFMQYERHEGGEQTDLPKPSIDTGMGLERMATILQNVHNNYDIDLFRQIIEMSVEFTGVKEEGDAVASHRVIADHLRSCSFLIADGVTPSNEGRGYVLRRIMRRAMRYAHTLGAKDPLMARLVPTLVTEMGGAFPELIRAQSLITETLQSEEEKFRSLLSRGIKMLDEKTKKMKPGDALPGDTAFNLYDTYGFPLDLTQDALRRQGFKVDTDGFEKAMAAQKAAARAAWSGSGDAASDKIWFEAREKSGPTEFIGYAFEQAEAIVTAIVQDGKNLTTAKAGKKIEFTTNQTPFYAESGGQAGDRGIAATEAGTLIEITDTKKRIGALHGHIGKITKGELRLGDTVLLTVDHASRTQTRANHSATHLLHAALRNRLGGHVAQKGSLVEAQRFRFDFSHNAGVTPEELAQLEQDVNAIIRQNREVSTRLMSYDAAVEAGAIALFGEKYEEEVRVLSMGVDLLDNDMPYSVELCGGTHVTRTGDIGLFVITAESAVGSGIRRIEALTGEAARLYLHNQANLVRDTAKALKTTPIELLNRSAALMQERKKLDRDLTEMRKKLALGGGSTEKTGRASDIEKIGAINFVGQVLEGIPAKELRGLVDEAKKKMGQGIAVFLAVNDGKAAITVGVTDGLFTTHSAVDLVRIGVAEIGGKGGGGRADMAQAGGPDGAGADKAIEAIRHHLAG